MKKSTWVVFWALVATFALNVGLSFTLPFRDLFDELFGKLFIVFSLGLLVIFSLLGVTLLALVVKEKAKGKLKKFLLLTGASAIGFFVFAILHNLVYGLFIHFYGEDFWNGSDEPFFFLLAIFVCPLGFIVGVIGSLVLHVKSKMKDRRQKEAQNG